jgi:hypothetical protein
MAKKDEVKVDTKKVEEENLNPQSVPFNAVDTPMKKVGGDEVSVRPPDTDIADVRADDTPEQAAEKIKAAREGRVSTATHG